MRITVGTGSGPVLLDRLTEEQRRLVTEGIQLAWMQIWQALSAGAPTTGEKSGSGRLTGLRRRSHTWKLSNTDGSCEEMR